MRSTAFVAAAWLCGCATTQQTPSTACPAQAECPVCPAAAATVASPVANGEPRGFTFANECVRGGDGSFAAQVEITAHYDCGTTSPCTAAATTLWQWYCDTNQDCHGIEATPLEAGRAIGVGDLNRVGGAGIARVVSYRGDVAVIGFGPLRTFTVNFAAGTVAYAESGRGLLSDALVNGSGEGRCRVSP